MGFAALASSERIPDAVFTATMATNVNGLFTFCREVGGRQLADGNGGSIINVASIAGLGAQPHFPAAYQASKAAVINLTRNLAASWAKRGVRVNALCPGWFPSEMTAPFFSMPTFWARIEEMTPMKRAGKDGELDAALLFMASDASSFMTGATMVIDGGTSGNALRHPARRVSGDPCVVLIDFVEWHYSGGNSVRAKNWSFDSGFVDSELLSRSIDCSR